MIRVLTERQKAMALISCLIAKSKRGQHVAYSVAALKKAKKSLQWMESKGY